MPTTDWPELDRWGRIAPGVAWTGGPNPMLPVGLKAWLAAAATWQPTPHPSQAGIVRLALAAWLQAHYAELRPEVPHG